MTAADRADRPDASRRYRAPRDRRRRLGTRSSPMRTATTSNGSAGSGPATTSRSPTVGVAGAGAGSGRRSSPTATSWSTRRPRRPSRSPSPWSRVSAPSSSCRSSPSSGSTGSCPSWPSARSCAGSRAKADRNAERLRRVAREAAMQSRRTWLPEVAELTTFARCVSLPGAAGAERDGAPPSLDRPTLLVGPGGGLVPVRAGGAARPGGPRTDRSAGRDRGHHRGRGALRATVGSRSPRREPAQQGHLAHALWSLFA